MAEGQCRFCSHPLPAPFLDLGQSPLANALISPSQESRQEAFYPLALCACPACWLVQLSVTVPPEIIFRDHYTYFSSYSQTWLDHAQAFSQQAMARFGFSATHQVMEVASNDGYLLQYFQQAGIPVLGIEPARNVAQVAQEKGIPTENCFLSLASAQELKARHGPADLLVANNVIAHVPHLNDFVAGLAHLLSPTGVLSIECPHWLALVEGHQFDTIYHEHYSYFSLSTLQQALQKQGLSVFDVELLPTHGGSMRVFASLDPEAHQTVDASQRVQQQLQAEQQAGLSTPEHYQAFCHRVAHTRDAIRQFLQQAHEAGKTVVGYGAPAKAVTLSMYCGIDKRWIPWTVDKSPHKQGHCLPGNRIPVEAPEKILETRPDYVFIFPWNLAREISTQLGEVSRWGGQFVIPVPTIQLLAPTVP